MDAGNYVLSTTTATDLADITAATLTPVIVADDKIYDGTTTATLSSQTVTGVIGSETVTLLVTAANFDTKDVGTDKTVTATGLSLGGRTRELRAELHHSNGPGGHYRGTLTPVIVADDKIYDGTTTATLSSQTVTGVVGSETVTLLVTAADFDTKDVGMDKTVTATGLSLGGGDAGNYVLGTATATDLADITAANR